jgi:hypothetical protein
MYEGFEVFVKGHGVKGFVCRLLNVVHVARAQALQYPLDSGLVFSVNHSSAAVGKLLMDIPYEHILDAWCVFNLTFFFH